MNSSILKTLSDNLRQKLLSPMDEGTYFSKRFQYLVIVNFLPLDVANELVHALPDGSEECKWLSNDWKLYLGLTGLIEFTNSSTFQIEVIDG